MKPVFSVILWNDEKPNFNHTVIFPAYPYALEDILEKVQAKNEASLHWEINDTVGGIYTPHGLVKRREEAPVQEETPKAIPEI